MPLHRYLHLQFTYFLYEEFIVLTDAGKIRIKTQIFRPPTKNLKKPIQGKGSFPSSQKRLKVCLCRPPPFKTYLKK